MLMMCPLTNSSVYVGETVQAKCFGSSFYVAYGLHLVLRRNCPSKHGGGHVVEELRGNCCDSLRKSSRGKYP
jgi:hypothetical protein